MHRSLENVVQNDSCIQHYTMTACRIVDTSYTQTDKQTDIEYEIIFTDYTQCGSYSDAPQFTES